jgi:hypothetical protein
MYDTTYYAYSTHDFKNSTKMRICFVVLFCLTFCVLKSQEAPLDKKMEPKGLFTTIEGNKASLKEICSDAELNFVVYWSSNSFAVRQVFAVRDIVQKYRDSLRIQVIVVSMGDTYEIARKRIEREMASRKEGHHKVPYDDWIILLDRLVSKGGKYTGSEATGPSITVTPQLYILDNKMFIRHYQKGYLTKEKIEEIMISL